MSKIEPLKTDSVRDRVSEEEWRVRVDRDLGPHKAMILRNHGLLVTGPSVARAFVTMRALELSCQAQMAAQAGDGELILPKPEVCEHTAKQYDAIDEQDHRSGPRSCACSTARIRPTRSRPVFRRASAPGIQRNRRGRALHDPRNGLRAATGSRRVRHGRA